MKCVIEILHKNWHFLYCLLIVLFLSGCQMGELKPQIEQEVIKGYLDNRTKIATYVWHKREIVWAKYDPIEKADSLLIVTRYKEAEEIVKRIKACR